MNILFKYIGMIIAICAFKDVIAVTDTSAGSDISPLTRQYTPEEIADKTRFWNEKFHKTKQFVAYFRQQVATMVNCPMIATFPNPQYEVKKISDSIEPALVLIEQTLEEITPEVIAEILGSGNEADLQELSSGIDKQFAKLKKMVLDARAKFGCQ